MREQNKREYIFPFTAEPYIFIGKKPAAVFFGEERVDVKNWRDVLKLILTRCNEKCHNDLMYLRNKVAGKVRVFISDKPDGMARPFMLDEDIYVDGGQYGVATLY